MSQKLKELYDYPFFHGIIWHENLEEAYNLCKAKMERSGKSCVDIFILLETQDKLFLRIFGYEKDDSEPVFKICPLDINRWHTRLKLDYCRPSVERRIPQDLSQIARATIMDQINCPCSMKTDFCVRNLEEKIDLLRIPESEKVNIKKLIHILNVVQ